MKQNSNGNVLFLILIAVALFAALSYAVTSSNRVGSKNADSEKLVLEQGKMDSYMAAINTGSMRLKMRGCDVITYTPPKDWINNDKKCFLFHPDGGGVIYQDMGVDDCALQNVTLATLSLGQGCGGVVYAGTSSGKRLYVTPADSATWTVYDSSGPYVTTGASSSSNGFTNTDTLVAAGARYTAANICRALGPKWYLPAIDEMVVIYNNRNASGLASSFSGAEHWSSTETATHLAFGLNMVSGVGQMYKTKNGGAPIRCARSD